MRKTFSFLVVLAATLSTNLFAQTNLKQVIIATGGAFEFAPPYQDHATIWAYNPSTQSLVAFDTVLVESVQTLDIDSNYAWLAAQDSIVQYDLNSLTRVGSFSFPNIYLVETAGGYVFAGKYYGGSTFLYAYNPNNYALIDSFPAINTQPYDVEVVGDSAYVSYNLKGTVDLFPPYGIYADSIGYLGVIYLPNHQYVRTISLGTAGAGAKLIAKVGTDLFVGCTEFGNTIKYNTTSGVQTTLNLGLGDYYNTNGNTWYAKGVMASEIVAVDLPSAQRIDTLIASSASLVTAAFEHINQKLYTTETDYTTYGKVFIYNATGVVQDSLTVGISPEAIAFDYRNTSTSLAEHSLSESSFVLYPQPAENEINIRFAHRGQYQVSIFDIYGKLIQQTQLSNINSTIDISSFESGTYIIQVVQDTHASVAKFIKL